MKHCTCGTLSTPCLGPRVREYSCSAHARCAIAMACEMCVGAIGSCQGRVQRTRDSHATVWRCLAVWACSAPHAQGLMTNQR